MTSEAQLVFDRRREGKLPYAWNPGGGRASTLRVQLSAAPSLAGIVISWAGATPARWGLRVDAEQLSPSRVEASHDGESVAWLRAPRTVSQIALQLPANATAGVAEIEPVPVDAPIWLISPRSRADWDLELLASYGATQAARLPPSANLDPAVAAARAIVLSNAPIDPGAKAQLIKYVERGGVLVELGPSPGVCGPGITSEELPDSSFVLSGAAGEGTRWLENVAKAGPCRRGDLACTSARVEVSARSLATQHTRALVVTQALGQGQCVRWLGDLAYAIRNLRQGDPARARGVAGAEPLKPADLFVERLAAQDVEIPSADRLGYALARQLLRGHGFDLLVAPLPDAAPSLLVLTADQDFVPNAGQLAQSSAIGSAGFTVMLTAADIGGKPDLVYPEAHAPMFDAAEVGLLAKRGHGAGIHPNLIGVQPAAYAEVIMEHAQRFREKFGAAPRVIRNHHLIWSGYVDMAEAMASAGLELDLDYVSTHRSGTIPPGFMTGSGLPMRFVDEQSRVLPIYQQATQLDDSAWISENAPSADAVNRLNARADRLLDIARREHVPLTALHHAVWWFKTNGAFQDHLIAQARARHMPIWGADRWLQFTSARRETKVRVRGRAFEVNTTNEGVTLLVDGVSTITVDGVYTPLTKLALLGETYQVLTLPRGTFVVAAGP